jgi:hypothetical protein
MGETCLVSTTPTIRNLRSAARMFLNGLVVDQAHLPPLVLVDLHEGAAADHGAVLDGVP